MIEKLNENKFFTGINYWGSKEAIHMWSKFDEASIEEDLRLLQEAGITHLRIFPLWSVFQPLVGYYDTCEHIYHYGFGEEPLPDTEAGRAGVSEEACRKLEIFCSLAEKYDMKLIVAMLTGQMSSRIFLPPALEGLCTVTDPIALKWEIRFIKYMVTRFKSQKTIVAWDLGNEVNSLKGKDTTPDEFHVWCTLLANTIKVSDPTRPVISGIDVAAIEKGIPNLKSMGEMCDINTTHPYHVFQTSSDPICSMRPEMDLAFKCRISEGIAGIPTFVQEYGSIGYLICSYETEADFYRTTLYSCLAHGCHGVMWWCAFDQGHFNYMPYAWNNIGSDYGFFDRNLQPKPIVKENIRFKQLLQKLPEGGLPKCRTNATVIVPRDDYGMNYKALRTTFMLAQRANMNVDFSYALDPIPDSPIYILPSLDSNRAIIKQRLDEILAKVEEGAVLYVSLGKALFRMVPEIFGVNFAWRSREGSKNAIMLDGEELPVISDMGFNIESTTAEVIARNKDNTPVYFKHKYGKGFVYLLTVPLEKSITDTAGVFYRDDAPRYDLIYRELAKTAGVCGKVDSDNPFVCLTEHYGEEGEIYIFAINYSNKQQRVKLSIMAGYELIPIFGPCVKDGVLEIEKNDGALYCLKKI